MVPVDVLIVADNREVAQIQASILKHRSITSVVSPYGSRSNRVQLPKRYDLVLVDSYYNRDEAIAQVQMLRPECNRPILLFTFENDVRYQLDAYAAGVDECILKPISELLILAKVGAWIRQSKFAGLETTTTFDFSKITYNGITLDPQSRQVSSADGMSLRLSKLEFRLLQIFVSNHGHVLETNQLLSKVWDHEEVEPRLLTNLVYRLRCKLSAILDRAGRITTVDRIGYMFE
jgi:DNA-binding response OmpR family regulator